jgi:hypothetical protein
MRLLARGWMMGMTVELDGRDLKVFGPRRSEAFVEEIRARKGEVVAYLQAQGCGAVHVQPERWRHRGGRAYCPLCNRFMGFVVYAAELPKGRTTHEN